MQCSGIVAAALESWVVLVDRRPVCTNSPLLAAVISHARTTTESATRFNTLWGGASPHVCLHVAVQAWQSVDCCSCVRTVQLLHLARTGLGLWGPRVSGGKRRTLG